MTKLLSLQFKFTLQYITLTNYYIVKDTFTKTYWHHYKCRNKNNRENKMTKLHSIYVELTSKYITLTDFYIVKDTFRSWIMTAP